MVGNDDSSSLGDNETRTDGAKCLLKSAEVLLPENLTVKCPNVCDEVAQNPQETIQLSKKVHPLCESGGNTRRC